MRAFYIPLVNLTHAALEFPPGDQNNTKFAARALLALSPRHPSANCCPRAPPLMTSEMAHAPPCANRFGPIHFEAPIQTGADSRFPAWCAVVIMR